MWSYNQKHLEGGFCISLIYFIIFHVAIFFWLYLVDSNVHINIRLSINAMKTACVYILCLYLQKCDKVMIYRYRCTMFVQQGLLAQTMSWQHKVICWHSSIRWIGLKHEISVFCIFLVLPMYEEIMLSEIGSLNLWRVMHSPWINNFLALALGYVRSIKSPVAGINVLRYSFALL